MILVVGLGNSGKKYQRTRHNVGFMVLDKLQKSGEFSDWKIKKKFKAEISEGILNSEKIILAKPQTFMNSSGKAAKNLVSSFKFQVSKIWVVHDDLDLPLGKIKIVKNRGSAGHKGVQSVIDELGTKNFIRFRIGIKPKTYNLKPKTLDRFVLEKFLKEEEKIIKEVIDKICQAIEMMVKEGVEKAMAKFNQ